MNWTGGKLQRHSKKGQGNAIVNKQKAYFAKARTKLQNTASHVPVFDPSFLFDDQEASHSTQQRRPSYSPQRQQRLDEFEDLLPVVRRSKSMSAPNRSSPMKASILHKELEETKHGSDHQLQTRHTKASAKGNHGRTSNEETKFVSGRERRKRNHTSLESEVDPATRRDVPRSMSTKDAALAEKRMELLTRSDWVGLRPSRPLHLDFVSNRGEEQTAKRRRISDQDRLRQVAVVERIRVPSINEAYMMSGAILRPHQKVEDILKIRIGEDALASQTVQQSSHFPEAATSQAHSSDSVMLHDEEALETATGFVLLDDDEDQEEGEQEREPRFSRDMEPWDNESFADLGVEKEEKDRSVYQSPTLPYGHFVSSRINTDSQDMPLKKSTLQNEEIELECVERPANLSHAKAELFVFPSSDQSIESLVDNLNSFRATAGTIRRSSSIAKGDQPLGSTDDSNDREHNDIWRKSTRMLIGPTNGVIETFVEYSDNLSGKDFEVFPRKRQWSIDATADNDEKKDLKVFPNMSDEYILESPSSPPTFDVHGPGSMRYEHRSKTSNFTDKKHQDVFTHPIEHSIPQETGIRSTDQSRPVEARPTPAVTRPEPETIPSKTSHPSAQDQDERWRAFIFGGLSSSSQTEVQAQDSTRDLETLSDVGNAMHAYASPSPIQHRPQPSSLVANPSSPAPADEPYPSDLLSITSRSPGPSSPLPATTALNTAKELQTTLATIAPSIPTQLQPSSSTSLFSRPFSLANASTTADILRTGTNPLNHHARTTTMTTAQNLSSDPLTRERAKSDGVGRGKRKREKGSVDKEGKETKRNRLIFRRPVPFGGKRKGGVEDGVEYIGRVRGREGDS